MKHGFQSAVSDGTDPAVVKPSEWNSPHVLVPTSISAGAAITADMDWVEVTGTGISHLPVFAEGLCFWITIASVGVIIEDSDNSPVINTNSQPTGSYFISCDGASWSVLVSPQAPSLINRIVATLTAAQFKALFQTPLTLILAQGAGKLINVLSATIFYHFVTTPYSLSGGEDLILGYPGGNDVSSTALAGLVDQSHDTFCPPTLLDEQAVGEYLPTGACVDQPYQVSVSADLSGTGGDGTVEIIIDYEVLTP